MLSDERVYGHTHAITVAVFRLCASLGMQIGTSDFGLCVLSAAPTGAYDT